MSEEEEPPETAERVAEGPPPPLPSSEHAITLARAQEMRAAAGLAEGEGPSPARIQRAVSVYVQQFDWWYGKQLRQIMDSYVEKIVRRINPYVRRAQLGDCTATDLAEAAIASWESRNFATAGGNALEALAIAIGPNCQKAVGTGLDIQRVSPEDLETLSLYVLKSGAITRNSDILAKMKQNVRKAEQLARQHPGTKVVRLNYAIAAGTFTNTFSDGVHRPSSPQFWSEIMELQQDKAIRLLWLVTDEAAKHIRSIERNRKSLVAKVAAYLAKEGTTDEADWDFLLKVANHPWRTYKAEHERRKRRAEDAGREILTATD